MILDYIRLNEIKRIFEIFHNGLDQISEHAEPDTTTDETQPGAQATGLCPAVFANTGFGAQGAKNGIFGLAASGSPAPHGAFRTLPILLPERSERYLFKISGRNYRFTQTN